MPVILSIRLLQIIGYLCVLGKISSGNVAYFAVTRTTELSSLDTPGFVMGQRVEDTSPGCAFGSVISIHYSTSMMMRSKTKYLLLAPLNPRV